MEEDEREKVDALCPECGHAFSAFVDRIIQSNNEPVEEQKAECPVCGCGECKIGK